MNKLIAGLVLGVALTSPLPAFARDLTFDERVKAQEAIERVYYSHQIGATQEFEEAVPRAILEKKVTTYLKQSVALEKFWHTSVTAEMLRREMERQAAQTRMPDRLRELYAALGDDAFLVEECLARPALVDRLTRSFYTSDATLHRAEKLEAEKLRSELVRLGPGAFAKDARRTELIVTQDALSPGSAARERHASAGAQRLEVDAAELERWRQRVPDAVGEVGALQEEGDSFTIHVLVEKRERTLRLLSFTVRKERREEWWKRVAAQLDARAVHAVAPDGGRPPALGAADSSRPPCIPDDTWNNASLDDVQSGSKAVWTGTVVVLWGGIIWNGGGSRYDPATDSWAQVSNAGSPGVRLHHTAIWTGREMVVWGGTTPYDPVDSGGRYDPTTDTWRPMTTSGAPSPRSQHAAVWADGGMLIWGGQDSNGLMATGGRYDPVEDRWTTISNTGAPEPRVGHTAVWTGSQMVVWGGLQGGTYFASGARYDPVADTWTPTSTNGAPTGRWGHTANWTDAEMFVWGGNDDSGNRNTGGRYDPLTDVWAPVSTLGAPKTSDGHSAFWTGSLVLVWGGGFPPSGGRYDPSRNEWTPISLTNAPGELAPVASWTGSLMVVFGIDGARYDPISDTWTPVSDGDGPTGNTSFAIWTGSRVIAWGNAVEGGGQYEPATDTWSEVTLVDAPPGEGATGVWTGSRMVVWGGSIEGSLLASGSRYDPIANVWTPTSMVNAPAARIAHTAVWTGSVMIVWGGYTGEYTATGARYDPVSDTWLPTTLSGAPEGRGFGHNAVWTGERMVVWGGSTPFAYLNTGGRYDPITDTWTATSTADAPSVRAESTAVSTGKEMIVWGGYNESILLVTGGRYDPVLDTWSPTSTLGAPAPRTRSAAVWTGSLMVIWGGAEVESFNTGARYDPVLDSWSPTSLVEAPVPRVSPSAAWLGNEMFVWGGGYRTGGMYRAAPCHRPPVADAGLDLVAECSGGGSVPVVLDGSRSTDPDSTAGTNDDIVAFEWSENGQLLGNGETIEVAFAPGTHPVRLTVTDSEGLTDTDDVELTVTSADIDGDGFTPCAGDCDDADPVVHPGASEICDGKDNDCNGEADDGRCAFQLVFPLERTAPCASGACDTPCTAAISAVVDRSGTPLDPDYGGACWYARDGRVEAYSGEAGDTFASCNWKQVGYSNAEGDPFTINGHYVGVRGCHPDPPEPSAPAAYLNFDGHPGYDFPAPTGTPILAAEGGILHEAHRDPINDCRGRVDAWSMFHAFTIDHGNGYSTWYLYADDLVEDVKAEIEATGSASVVKGQTVAYAGSFGRHCRNCTHLHFEVRRHSEGGTPEDGAVVDPYAPGSFLWADADADGIADSCDNCVLRANPAQADTDGDGIGDACNDADDPDGDEWAGALDNCPSVANPDQADGDGDLVGDACDNCPAAGNTDQADRDQDRIGDACDACPDDPGNDPDEDGVCAAIDNCPLAPNPGQEDGDADGAGDLCDPCPNDPLDDQDTDGACADVDNCPAIPNADQLDRDGDGLGDVCDACPLDASNDADQDGLCADADNCPAVSNPGQQDSEVGPAAGEAWATTATASSEYGSPEYGAMQATGPPIAPTCDDNPLAWAPLTDASGPEWLELRYDPPFQATGVRVYEGDIPAGGFVTRVELIDTDGLYRTVWTGTDTTPCGGQLAPTWERTTYDVAGARITTETPGWEEIDAVALVGFPPFPDPDGVGDACDNCPGVFNADQHDADGDGIGDACDTTR